MELAIWTACADHQVIQNSTLCQSMMAKDFSSEFAKREVLAESKEMTVVIKRDVISDESLDLNEKESSAIKESHFSNFFSSLSLGTVPCLS